MSSAPRPPLTRDPFVMAALRWSIPALILGLFLRLLFLRHLPYAFWGADSRSYFSFAQRLLVTHEISLDAKRRYLYPIFLLPIAALPGAALRWLACIQHLLGLLSVWPLAYLLRRSFVYWRLWIV